MRPGRTRATLVGRVDHKRREPLAEGAVNTAVADLTRTALDSSFHQSSIASIAGVRPFFDQDVETQQALTALGSLVFNPTQFLGREVCGTLVFIVLNATERSQSSAGSADHVAVIASRRFFASPSLNREEHLMQATSASSERQSALQCGQTMFCVARTSATSVSG